MPQRKLQYRSREKIRQFNLIIFQQLHAAGYGCLLVVRAECQTSAFQPNVSLMNPETKGSQDVLSMYEKK